jgi:hypothetical protein
MSSLIDPSTSAPPRSPGRDVRQIDPRGLRFAAAVTTAVLAVALVAVGTPIGAVALSIQAVVFALGSLVGLGAQPYGVFFRRVIRPHLEAPTELEDPAPPRFAQAVGLIFVLIAGAALALGSLTVVTVALAAALAAAFLNAAFGYCLGCEFFLIAKRVTSRLAPARI